MLYPDPHHEGREVKLLPLPVDVEEIRLGLLDLSEAELIERFGPGHSPDQQVGVMPGPVQLWPFRLPDGQIAVLEHHTYSGVTAVLASPQDLDRALRGLEIPATRLTWRKPATPSPE